MLKAWRNSYLLFAWKGPGDPLTLTYGIHKGPTQMKFLGHANGDIREQKNCDIRYIAQYYKYNISAECGYQILVTKICNGGKISYILRNFIPNISVWSSV